MQANGAEGAKAGAREFVVDTAAVAATQFLLKARALVTIPLIVKFLGTAQYGVWAQTLVLVDLVGTLLGANLSHPLVRFLAEKPAQGKSIYSTLMAATLAMSAAGGLVIFLSAESISHSVLNDPAALGYVRVGALLALCYNVRLVNLNVYRAVGRLRERSLFELASTFGQLAGITCLLWRGRDLLAVFHFMAAWEVACGALLSWRVGTIVGWGALQKSVLADAVRYSLPLMPAVLSVSVLDRSDRLVIGYFQGAEAVGVYSASYALASLLMLFQTPLQMTLLPKVSALWAADRAAAARYISLSNKVFLTLAIPYLVALPLVAPRLLEGLGNARIARASGTLTLLVAAGVLLWGVSVIQSQVFYGARRTLPVGCVTVAAAVLNLLLCYLLVPVMGINGAALATFASFGGACLALHLLGRQILRLNFYGLHLLKCGAAALAMGAVLWVLLSAAQAPFVPAVVAGGLTYLTALWLLRAVVPAEMSVFRNLLLPPAGPLKSR